MRRFGNALGVILPKALTEERVVTEGTLLKTEKREGVLQTTPADAEFSRQVEAFLRTKAQHRHSYRELAK